ncbi:MAG: hypothetical protein WAU70_02395 [Flavobacteriales bacterium]
MLLRPSAISALLLCSNCFASIVASGGGGNAGDDNAIAVCSTAPAFLMIDSLLGSPQPGGTWSAPGGTQHSPGFVPGVDPAGTYCYVVGNDTACLTVMVTTAPNAGTNAYVVVCSNGVPIDYFSHLGGNPDIGGTWSQCGANVFCYVVYGTPPCENDTARLTVIINQAPDAGIDAAIEVCENADPFILFDELAGTPQATGTWTFNGIGQNGIFVPGTSPPGVYCYTVQGVPPCANATSCLSITVLPSTDPDCNSMGISAVGAISPSLDPEPSNGTLFLSGMIDERFTAEVFDASGRSQWHGTVLPIGGSTQLQLPQPMKSGRYALVLHNGSGTELRLPFTLVR